METPQWILLCLEGAKALRVLLPPLLCQQASLALGTSGRPSRAQQPRTQALPGQAGWMLAGGQGKATSMNGDLGPERQMILEGAMTSKEFLTPLPPLPTHGLNRTLPAKDPERNRRHQTNPNHNDGGGTKPKEKTCGTAACRC